MIKFCKSEKKIELRNRNSYVRKIKQEKLAKKAKINNYINTLLQKSKVWNRPVTSVDELQMAIKRNPDNQTALVRTELAY